MKPQNYLSYGTVAFFSLVSLLFICSTTLFASRNIKFSVDLNLLVSQNKFNPATDVVYIRGTFNSWGTTTPLAAAGNNVYSVTIPLVDWSYHEYKYFVNTSGAANGGYENNFPVASSGNRKLSVGVNDLTLPTVFYNDAEMDKLQSTSHFNIYYTAYDNSFIDEFALRIEKCYSIISNAIQSFPAAKVNIYLYKDLDQLHMACGFPENGPGSIGSAWGATLITMLAPSKSSLDDALGLFTHEFTHCLIAAKTKVSISTWVNEGVASYYGLQFSTKDWIKSMMDVQGKPNIEDIWNGNMGYAYSGILAYYIIKTKGEAAMAKFIENMNYADIGYANIAALQTDWHAFLDLYLDYQTKVNVKFSLDMADMIGAKYFNAATDKVFVNMRETLSDWSPTQMTLESGTVYSVILPVNRYNFFEYKFSTNSATAPNSGYELKVDETTLGCRLLDVGNSNKTLPTVKFNSNVVVGLDMTPINNMLNVLKINAKPWNTPGFSSFKYSFKVLTATEYNAQKPTDVLPFDCGFVSSNGTINVSAPTTTAQLAVFKDINKAAVYYLCQAYMYYFYQTSTLPLLLKVGFPAYESRIEIADAVIKTSVNAYGGNFSLFDVLNNPTTFVTNNGYAVAHAFGEFMNIFKIWGYPNITSVSANGFDAASWWYNTNNLQGLLDDFNRYIYARFLEPNENLRIKMVMETEHLRFFTRPVDAAVNFPVLGDSLENAYKEYSANYGVRAYQKITALTLADCTGAYIDGVSCDPATLNIGGTAWPTGLSFGCTSKPERIKDVIHLGRHELAHSFGGFMPSGDITQWLGEGFAFFSDAGPLNADYSNVGWGKDYWRQLAISSLERGTTFFGHRPTYEDTKVYPGYETDYGYKYLGYFLCDFIYRKGGYMALKEVMLGDLAGYKKMGYASGQAIMDAFYFDFDVQLQNKKVVSLISPTVNVDETSTSVNISWIPLSPSTKLNVSVSTDKGLNWTTIATNTNATSCSWNAGNYIGKFMLKFSAPDVFDDQTTYGPFNKIDLAKPMINFPIGNEYLIAGDTVDILWANTTLSNFKIEFSDDNGTSWSTVNSAVAASAKNYKWIVPWTISNLCKIRISDAANSTNKDFSNNCFTILRPNLIGGPYLNDKNTMALLHFDNDLNNRSNLSGNGNGSTLSIVSDNVISPILGNCYMTTSAVSIPHNANLSLSGDWTIEAWVKLNSFSSNSDMFIITKPGDTDSYASNYSLDINPWWGNVFFAFFFSENNSRIGVTSQTVKLNEWYHVAMTRDTKNKLVNLYVHDKNRNVLSIADLPYTPTATYLNSKDVLIGSGIDGFVDEVRISNVVRTFINTGVDELKTKRLFSVYPNPCKGIVHINTDLQNEEKSVVCLMDVNGRVLKIVDLKKNETVIDLKDYSKGMYFIQMRTDSYTQTEKMILQ